MPLYWQTELGRVEWEQETEADIIDAEFAVVMETPAYFWLGAEADEIEQDGWVTTHGTTK